MCELCHSTGRIIKSHLDLPAFAYKRLRDAGASNRNPNPVLVTSKGVRQTSLQQKQHLLCSYCENDRFSKLGEHWVSNMCLQTDGSFPLKEALGPHPTFRDSKASFYETAGLSSISHSALEYFAASMIWRAQFVVGGTQHINLGPYDQDFRNYLLGKQTFPEHVSLAVCVRDSEYARISFSPLSTKVRLARMYSFYIPGLSFYLVVGRDRGEQYRSFCFVHAPMRRIFSEMLLAETLPLKFVLPALETERCKANMTSL